jgi:solute carrier family 35 protein E3
MSKPSELEMGADLEAQKASLMVDNETDDGDDDLHPHGHDAAPEDVKRIAGVSAKPPPKASQSSFIIWTAVNTLATIGIVFTNKAIFDDASFKHMQTSFAAFHFLCTSLTLFVISRPSIGMFVPKKCAYLEILPLSFAMCFNVILPNFSLAYSSITFYQIARILLTPTVALINFLFYKVSIPLMAALSLFPVCLGVGAVSYYDTRPAGNGAADAKVTTVAGVVFAFTGVLASSLYTVWIGTFHRKLGMSSMQLLFNQAPVSSFLLLFCIPLADTIPSFGEVHINRWLMILMSGGFASLINLSQFFIIAGAGAVSSTVVGHAKTCSIVMLGWMISGRSVSDKSLLGIFLAIGGIIFYSFVMLKHRAKA